jgi:sporulation protein YlmC with PRC-barrel domain
MIGAVTDRSRKEFKMFTRRIRNTISRWKISSTAAIAVLVLSGSAIGQEIKAASGDQAPTIVTVSHNPDDFRMAPRWQKANDLINKKVTNSGSENLGKLEDIVFDPNSGRILYGVLSFGGFLGMGDKLFAIPWQSLQLSADSNAFTLNVDKDRLKDAPGFDKSQWPNFADEQWATTTFKYYNQKPYWLSRGDIASDDYRVRWTHRATAWQKVSDLTGKRVVDARNEETGKLRDCIIDADGGRILYGVVSFSDKNFAVPWTALTLPKDAKQLVLTVNKDQFTDTISFSNENWPNMADERWATETYTYYRVQPYWTKTVVVTEER